MKAVSSSFMTALVAVALFLGNCFTCPQVLMAMAAHHPAHGCCHHPQPAQTGCQTQLLQNFVKAESSSPAPGPEPAPAEAAVAVSPFAGLLPLADRIAAAPLEPAPPDPLSLSSSFRV